jgi:hypothetical protein
MKTIQKVLNVICGGFLISGLLFAVGCSQTQDGPFMDLSTSTNSPGTLSSATATRVKMPLNAWNNSGITGSCTIQRKASGSADWRIVASGLPASAAVHVFVHDEVSDNNYVYLGLTASSQGRVNSGSQDPISSLAPGTMIDCLVSVDGQLGIGANTDLFPAP